MDSSLPTSQPVPPPVTATLPQPPPSVPPPPKPYTKPGARNSRLFFLLGGLLFVVLMVLVVIFILLPLFSPKPELPITLQYWGVTTPKSAMQPLIAEFEQKHPLIKVVYEEHTFNQYRKKLTTRLNNNTGPDLYQLHSSWLPMFGSNLLPLEASVISPDAFTESFYPVAGQDLERGGALYGIPLTMDTLVLFVNKNIFAAAGATVPSNWNDFINVARALTVKDENNKIRTAGAALGTYDNVTHAADIIAMLLVQNGVPLTQLGKSPERVTDTLRFYTAFARGDESVWDTTLDESRLAFAKENLAMYFGYATDIAYLKEQNATLDFAVYKVPSLADLTLTTVSSYTAVGIAAKTPYPKQAQSFMKFLAAKATQQKLLEETVIKTGKGVPSARKDLVRLIQDNAYLTPVIEQAPLASPNYFVDETFDEGINAQMTGYLGNAVRASADGNVSEDTVKELIEGVSKVSSVYMQ